MERWKPVVGYPGYEVSDLGRVRSIDREVHTKKGWRRYKGKLLSPGPTGKFGHLTVALGKGNSQYVHVLVLTAFVGECPPGCESLHGDSDPSNNKLSNLRWGTKGDNMRDRAAAGNYALSPEQVAYIRRVYVKGDLDFGGEALARKFGVYGSTIHDCAEGRTYNG